MQANHDARRSDAFKKIYENDYWEKENRSGNGSSLLETEQTRIVVEKVVQDYQIKSIVDVACGDFKWMPLVLKHMNDVSYIGCDIVQDLVEEHRNNFPQYDFMHLDFVINPVPKADLIICREAFQHLPIQDIKEALKNFSVSGAKFLLATLHLRRGLIRNHRNIRPGRCRDRNLLIRPFSLPNPIAIYPDTSYQMKDKFIGLWSLPFIGGE